MIAILSAMAEEMHSLLPELKDRVSEKRGGREYHQGKLWGQPVILVFSRWGKVAAATTATELISRYQVRSIVFSGVAGGVARGLKIGDLVIANSVYQHDLDARPIFPLHEIPLLGKARIETDRTLTARLMEAAQAFAGTEVGVHLGVIASGDQVISSQTRAREIVAAAPDTLCVEMEGAAVAQVCHEYGVPFALLRVISDNANEDVHVDFQKFIAETATRYTHGVLERFLRITQTIQD